MKNYKIYGNVCKIKIKCIYEVYKTKARRKYHFLPLSPRGNLREVGKNEMRWYGSDSTASELSSVEGSGGQCKEHHGSMKGGEYLQWILKRGSVM
jgi:hypothetical protein